MFKLFELSTFQLRGFLRRNMLATSLWRRALSGLRSRNRHSCTRRSAETRAMTRRHSGLSGVMGRFFIARQKSQALLIQAYYCSLGFA